MSIASQFLRTRYAVEHAQSCKSLLRATLPKSRTQKYEAKSPRAIVQLSPTPIKRIPLYCMWPILHVCLLSGESPAKIDAIFALSHQAQANRVELQNRKPTPDKLASAQLPCSRNKRLCYHMLTWSVNHVKTESSPGLSSCLRVCSGHSVGTLAISCCDDANELPP